MKNQYLKKHRIYLDVTFEDLCIIKSALEVYLTNQSRVLLLPDSGRSVKRDRDMIKRITRVTRFIESFSAHIKRIFNGD